MINATHVPLIRTFSPFHKTDEDARSDEIMAVVGRRVPTGWDVVEGCHRAVILAGAGIGKTHEMRLRAKLKRAAGNAAFFIRLEDIDAEFEFSFEIGNAEEFSAWLDSTNDAWFYLDSIDEARLKDPRCFEKAITRFARRIDRAKHRAHIVLSGRPYAWRSHTDYEMVNRHLPFARPKIQIATEDDKNSLTEVTGASLDEATDEDETLKVFLLNDLSEADIRLFAKARGAQDVDRFVDQIQRRNLMSIAARPFDLEDMVAAWRQSGELGSRLDFLSKGINMRLSEVDPVRRRREPLNLEKARKGARSLAAAVVLSGEAGIRVPDETPHADGIDAEAVLGDWEPGDVDTLLQRGIFDDAIFGKVRFRHREVRELLAAEWLAEHLKAGTSRRAVEALIFREKYGHRFIAPRLRPLLPWLILLDDDIRQKAVALSPEIVVEGGDPSRLPFGERRQLLCEIVEKIAMDVSPQLAFDNAAISRIAEPDLSEDVLRLIEQHRRNDDALTFLGRLVWQGEMETCLGPLRDVAADAGRGLYARIASLRAVATVGTRAEIDAVWDQILSDGKAIDRRLAAEVLSYAASDPASIDRVLATLDLLPPYDRFQVSGLSEALCGLIDRLDILQDEGPRLLARLISALNGILGREPHLEGGRERISRDYKWLLAVAAHAVERLIRIRSPHVLAEDAVAILHKLSDARAWHDVNIGEHAKRLQTAVPAWPELNDAVFWSAIVADRARKEARGGERVTEPTPWINYEFCRFQDVDFDRVLSFIPACEHEDDKLVAASLAFQLTKTYALPEDALIKLRGAVASSPTASAHVEGMISWRPSKEHLAMLEEHESYERESEQKRMAAVEQRRGWIAALRADPSRVRRPQSVELGQITNIQLALMNSTRERNGLKWRGADWRSLIGEFGEDVAAAYRDAAMGHWRHYSPAIVSEGNDTREVPCELIFGLAGLEIEAEQTPDFPKNLSDDELRLAMRYSPCELNGFPTWLEQAFLDRPDVVLEAVLRELAWDLERVAASRDYILDDIVHYVPWLHAHIAGWITDWLEANATRDTEVLRKALSIAKASGNPGRLADLARIKVEAQSTMPEQAMWFALWVDTAADDALPILADWLGAMPTDEASKAAQHVITGLLGGRRAQGLGSGVSSYRTPLNLKHLLVLMHQHIRVEDDIHRAGKGVYTPELRDEAQDARDALLHLLCEIPGKETWLALQDLAKVHPNPEARPWMLCRATERAVLDGDLESWSEAQLRAFDADQTLVPTTNAQLFSLAVQRLLDMREWLQDGNDSPYKTWQRAETETEMRNLIAGHLRQHAKGHYTCAQENELPNGQRPDIWVQRSSVTPVPIELKLLDKDWSGPDLCERLRNQLVGDYLREEAGGRGVMLLVWQGPTANRTWEIGGRRVGLEELEAALQEYWGSISENWPEIEEVKVIVIDLTRRGRRSGR